MRLERPIDAQRPVRTVPRSTAHSSGSSIAEERVALNAQEVEAGSSVSGAARRAAGIAVLVLAAGGVVAGQGLAQETTTCFGLQATVSGSGTVVGTAGNDVIVGSFGSDTIDGGGGNDRICGLDGDDTLVGGPGNDRVDGGPDTDTVVGDRFAPKGDVAGPGGNDELLGDPGDLESS